MRIISALAVAASLTGCATYTWHIPPGGNQAQFNQDSYACAKEAQELTPGGPPPGTNITQSGLYHQCMNAHGYRYDKTQN